MAVAKARRDVRSRWPGGSHGGAASARPPPRGSSPPPAWRQLVSVAAVGRCWQPNLGLKEWRTAATPRAWGGQRTRLPPLVGDANAGARARRRLATAAARHADRLGDGGRRAGKCCTPQPLPLPSVPAPPRRPPRSGAIGQYLRIPRCACMHVFSPVSGLWGRRRPCISPPISARRCTYCARERCNSRQLRSQTHVFSAERTIFHARCGTVQSRQCRARHPAGAFRHAFTCAC